MNEPTTVIDRPNAYAKYNGKDVHFLRTDGTTTTPIIGRFHVDPKSRWIQICWDSFRDEARLIETRFYITQQILDCVQEIPNPNPTTRTYSIDTKPEDNVTYFYIPNPILPIVATN